MSGLMGRGRFAEAPPAAADPQFLRSRVDRYFAEDERRSVVVGRTPNQRSVQLRANDYLQLGGHADVLAAQAERILGQNNGCVMSGVFLDEGAEQCALERRLAAFMNVEACAISQSGYNANVGLIQAIAGQETPVYLDMRAHMSLWEGAQSAGARPIAFRHNDATHLERQIKAHGPGVICVDSVYSTVGSICPLVDVAEISDRHECALLVDESHSLGTHGPSGAGLVVELGIEDKVHFRTASLAKAFAGRGGLVAGSARNLEFFRFRANPAVFSSVVLGHDIAAFGAVLDIVAQEEWRRIKLHHNARYLRDRLCDIGYDVSQSDSQIIPLEAGPEDRTVQLRDALEQRDVFGAVFCAPATPRNRSMVRLSLHCGLSKSDMDKVVDVCWSIRDIVRPDQWPAARKGARQTAKGGARLCA